MPTPFDTRPAAYAVIVQDGEILLPYWVEKVQNGRTVRESRSNRFGSSMPRPSPAVN
jgi:hypothetical protein